MPTYKVTDPDSGMTLKLTGDSPPTEDELISIFAEYADKSHTKEPLEEVRSRGIIERIDSAIGNIPKDISQNIIDPLLGVAKSPLEAGRNIAGLIKGGAQTAFRSSKLPKTPEQEQFGQMVAPYVRGFQKPQEIPGMVAEFIEEKPATAALAAIPAISPVAKEVMGALKAVPSAGEFKSVVTHGMEKGIRPSVSGKANYPQTQKYFNQAESAVKSIIENKPNLEFVSEMGDVKKATLPQSLSEFSDAIHQTKKGIFEKYDAMTQATNQTPIRVDLNLIVKQLEATQNSRPIQLNHPDVSKYLADKAERYTNMGSLSPIEAQEVIADLNNSLKAFYKNPSYESASKAATDAMIANKLRKALDDAISQVSGPGYQQLKNEYGALSTIEKDVAHRAVVDARKNIRGLIDFSNIWSGAELATGIMTLNPVHMARAATIEAIRKYTKYLNDPNRIVSNMFKKAEKNLVP